MAELADFLVYPRVNVPVELTYLRANSDPQWERSHRDGVDITGHPDLQTPDQRTRRAEFEPRVRDYRARGLL